MSSRTSNCVQVCFNTESICVQASVVWTSHAVHRHVWRPWVPEKWHPHPPKQGHVLFRNMQRKVLTQIYLQVSFPNPPNALFVNTKCTKHPTTRNPNQAKPAPKPGLSLSRFFLYSLMTTIHFHYLMSTPRQRPNQAKPGSKPGTKITKCFARYYETHTSVGRAVLY